MRRALVALALLAAAPAAAQSSRDCDCRDLQDLQRELDNAIKLQQFFQGSVQELRGYGPDASQIAFQQVAQRAWDQSRAQGSGRHEHNVLSSFYGSDVSSDLFGEQTPARRAQLCQPTANMRRDLDEAMRAAPCRGIAEALRRHEQHHVDACIASERSEGQRRFVGYPAWIRQTGAEFAEQEVAAYGAQIAALREALSDVLDRSNFALEGETRQNMAMPPNPLYSAINVMVRNRIELRRSGSSGDRGFVFQGEGPFTVNATILGRCSFTGGVPYTLTARAELRSDGTNAEVAYSLAGAFPNIGVQCDIPGAGRGRGGVTGGAVQPEPPGRFTMPMRDGGEWRYDLSQSEIARMAAGAGVRVTGETMMRLVCRPAG
jgi:hypothetical protein